ncbi:MAG TPA: type II toxin-antitoxin system VapC family toxin [Bryobacteraceae bacterium]|nr:type II toxin-antitoxin system VapC family toxin [Bryobacteraceae bacterium]
MDANILIYAFNKDAPQHRAAAYWIEGLFNGSEAVGLPWTTLWAFLRICTDARVWPKPISVKDAFAAIHEWLDRPNLMIIHPGPRHAELLEALVREGNASGPLVSDAALAALAMENGAALASTDRDFSRFRDLRWTNPLE